MAALWRSIADANEIARQTRRWKEQAVNFEAGLVEIQLTAPLIGERLHHEL